MLQLLAGQTAAARSLTDYANTLRTLAQSAVELRALLGEIAAQGLDEDNATRSMPVSIYLADESTYEEVEASVERWLAEADVSIDARDEPVIGSWFRRMEATMKTAAKTPAAREAILTAVHVADSHLVHAQDAYVTATLLQNVGPVLQALQPTKDAVVRAGALLIVKIEWVVQVHQLPCRRTASSSAPGSRPAMRSPRRWEQLIPAA